MGKVRSYREIDLQRIDFSGVHQGPQNRRYVHAHLLTGAGRQRIVIRTPNLHVMAPPSTTRTGNHWIDVQVSSLGPD
jgi:hypothetical protein